MNIIIGLHRYVTPNIKNKNRKYQKYFIIFLVFPMNSITQDILYKQSAVKYDRTAQSLKNKSRRPHSHPKQHTEYEIKLIKNYKSKNKYTGLVLLWIKLKGAGYTRSITSLYRVMQRLGIYNKALSKKKEYEPKPYEQMTYPGKEYK